MTDILHAAESQLFDDTLSCELALPVAFRVGSAPGRPAAAETLLRSLAQVEDLRSDDGHEERGELPLLVQRMDAKLDLMLALLGRLARQGGQELPLRPVRWSRRGMRLETGGRSGAQAGAAGVLSLQPGDWLPEAIDLPVTVLAEAASGTGGCFLWLRFDPLDAGLEAALERHLFRLHRRQIAEARRARPDPA
ncbi:PilZ domain-containing protein [Stenotrophomonas sp. HITSZ_GD]|uniref:PilZ domain-containing protein n=1 Tax=Stenotrophomonas sp. HITSZ_GD TaxID=3037248 RepID=UPI00240E2438|nr:PilZ domain-containing protein [Stenotrophomonas sp. HITSZ_GD]MDG2526536.1 PilZ domain-containing protein [Stenotrophomonas sp. HITSZ_GD]